MKLPARHRDFFIGCLFMIGILTQPCWATQSPDTQILILNSYHPNYVWTDRITAAILNGLKGVVPDENIMVEYLDARRSIDDSAYYELIRKYIFEKYKHKKPELIFSCDDFAMNFIYKYQEVLFPGTPVVYGGVNVFPMDSLRTRKNFIGVYEGLPVQESLNLIVRVQPDVQKIVILCDPTHLGTTMYIQAQDAIRVWKHTGIQTEAIRVKDIYQLKKDVQKTDTKTAFLLIAIHKDAKGNYFSFSQHLKEISDVSKSPIYGFWGGLLIGNGSIGGYINDPYVHGTEIAKIGRQLLEGVDIHQIQHPVQTPYLPRFDYRVMQKYGIIEKNLPPNAVIYFKPESFYEKNQKLVIMIAIIGCILLLIICILYLAYRRTSSLSRKLHMLNIRQRLASNETKQLVYSLSHTIRLDACNIEGYLHLYELSDKKTTDEMSMLVTGIQSSIFRLKQTLDDIIHIGSRSRETDGQAVMIDFTVLINQVMQILEKPLNDVQAQVQISNTTKFPFYYYTSEIHTLLEELFLNSIRFKDPNRNVYITVSIRNLSHTYTEICIEDNGLGMDLALYGNKLFRLFEKFHSSQSGKGIGLYLMKSIVDWRGGSIEVASKVSEGTILTITLRNQH